MADNDTLPESDAPAPPLSRFEKLFPIGLRKAESRLLRERRAHAFEDSPAAHPKTKPDPDELAGMAGTDNDDRVGVALSGGGIRSATFCLGVFQGLADKGLLRHVDYLSTVSGGGYFGGFFGRLCGREWLRSKDSSDLPPGDEHLIDEPSPMSRIEAVMAKEDSWPMRYLRNCGRYINPTGSGDWGLALATVLRNWVATLLVLWTLAFAVFMFGILVRGGALYLAVPEMGEAWLAGRPVAGLWLSPWIIVPALLFLVFSLPAGIAYWLTQAPWWSSFGLNYKRLRAELWGPALIVLASLALMWAGPEYGFLDDQPWIPVLAAIQVILAIFWYERARRLTARGDQRYGARNILARSLSRSLFYVLAWLGLVLIDSIAQSLYAGRQHGGAVGDPISFLQLLGGFLGFAAIAASGERLAQLLQKIPFLKNARVPAAAMAIVASGVLWGGFLLSAAYLAHSTAWDGREPGIEQSVNGVPMVLAPGALLQPEAGPEVSATDSTGSLEEATASSFGTAPVSTQEETASQAAMEAPGLISRAEFVARSDRDPDRRVAPHRTQTLVTFVIAALLSLLFGHTYAFFNMSSLHSFYSARLSRAYLGASNKKRFRGSQDIGTPIAGDDVTWSRYRPWRNGGPLHIVNQTLNMTVGGTRQIEARDRRGQNLAVGPSGVSVGVTDHARWGDLHSAGLVANRKPRWTEEEAKKEAPFLRRAFQPITPLNVYAHRFHALGVPPVRKEALHDRERFAEGAVTKVEKRMLGRNIAISGAAFTTGVGYRTRAWFTLLAAFFNVRLGYWWSVRPRREDFDGTKHASAKVGLLEAGVSFLLPVQGRLISEALGLFRGAHIDRWYVSDGGHFENMALYEMIRRRVPFVIACDCGEDESFGFNDLAVLTRHLRIDFQAELEVLDQNELASLNVHPQIAPLLRTPETFLPQPAKGKEDTGPRRSAGHGLLARVRYRAEEGENEPRPTYILFVKPSVLGDEPEDVLHYQRVNKAFPQQPTIDQDYDEAQWESYRKLGRSIASKLFADVPAAGAWRPFDMEPPA